MTRPLRDLLMTHEAAEQLGITEAELLRWTYAKRIGCRKIRGFRRYDRAEVARLAAERAEGSG